jgi:DNA-directed RNA polymerase II subunit RPB1
MCVHWDCTVRSANGDVVDWNYGIDQCDNSMLERVELDFLAQPPSDFTREEQPWFDELRHACLQAKVTLLQPKLTLGSLLPFHPMNVLEHHRRAHEEMQDSDHGQAFQLLHELLDQLRKAGHTLFLRAALCYYLRWHNVRRRFSLATLVNILNHCRELYRRARVAAGELVGAQAASSVSEPITQMNLNTFHYAGVQNLSLVVGIPRLRELILLATKMRTPMCTMALLPSVRSNREFVTKYAATLNETLLKDVIESATAVEWSPDPFTATQQTDQLLTQSYGCNVQAQVLPAPQNFSRWVLRLVLNRTKLSAVQLSLSAVASALRAYFPNESMYHLLVAEPHMPEAVIRLRMQRVARQPEESEFERHMAQLLLAHLSTNLLLTGLRGVRQTQVIAVEGEYQLQVAGNNLLQLWELELCDWTRTWTNNVRLVAETLGIESAAHQLYHELRQVLEANSVSPAHLMMIVNAMTRTGTLTPLNRFGLAKQNVGPLTQCSFEETVPVLFEAAQFAKLSEISGISDNIIMGGRIRGGTGTVEILALQDPLQPLPPASPAFRAASPAYRRTPTSPLRHPTSPLHHPTSPLHHPTSPTSPGSPVYRPASPVYRARSPSPFSLSGPTSPRHRSPSPQPDVSCLPRAQLLQLARELGV